MWIFLNNAMLSVVEHKDDAGLLMVRARIRGDLQRAFSQPRMEVLETPNADYRFRCLVDRQTMADALIRAVGNINYVNFKKSIPADDPKRHHAYLRVWNEMAHEQNMQRLEEHDDIPPHYVGDRSYKDGGPVQVMKLLGDIGLDGRPASGGKVSADLFKVGEATTEYVVPVTRKPGVPLIDKKKPNRLGRVLKAGEVYVNRRGKKAARPR